MPNYRDAESKTDSLLMSLVRSPVSLAILAAAAVVFFVAGAWIF